MTENEIKLNHAILLEVAQFIPLGKLSLGSISSLPNSALRDKLAEKISKFTKEIFEEIYKSKIK